jgi:hypothetical protein
MGAHTNVFKTCLTKEKFDKANFMVTHTEAETSKQTVATNTPTSLNATVACRANTQHRTGPYRGAVLNDLHRCIEIHVHLEPPYHEGRRTMTAKWLGAVT